MRNFILIFLLLLTGCSSEQQSESQIYSQSSAPESKTEKIVLQKKTPVISSNLELNANPAPSSAKTDRSNEPNVEIRQKKSPDSNLSEQQSIEERERSANWDPDRPDDAIRREILNLASNRFKSQTPFPTVNSELAAEQKIHVLKGKNFTLYTDLPITPFIQEIPAVLDRALIETANYFKIVAESDQTNSEQTPLAFKIEAFLIRDPERFHKLGVFEGVPKFENGYSIRNRIFALDQKIDYYNRFLLLHELVHTFMFRYFGELAPRWYSEGIAELIALHKWRNDQLKLAVIPNSSEETPGFERLQKIQRDVRNGQSKSLNTIFQFIPDDYRQVETYAWSWAFVLFLTQHPDYRERFRKMSYFMTYSNPTARFIELFADRSQKLPFDWLDFQRHFDFGYNFNTNRIEYIDGVPFNGTKDIDINVDRTWQSTQIKLFPNKTYRIRAIGRFEVFDPRKMLPCEPNGITLRYYQGEPLGKLMAVILPDSNSLKSNEKSNINSDRISEIAKTPEIIPIGNNFSWQPKTAGTLYLRINCSGAQIEKNRGTVKVRLEQLAPDL